MNLIGVDPMPSSLVRAPERVTVYVFKIDKKLNEKLLESKSFPFLLRCFRRTIYLGLYIVLGLCTSFLKAKGSSILVPILYVLPFGKKGKGESKRERDGKREKKRKREKEIGKGNGKEKLEGIGKMK